MVPFEITILRWFLTPLCDQVWSLTTFYWNQWQLKSDRRVKVKEGCLLLPRFLAKSRKKGIEEIQVVSFKSRNYHQLSKLMTFYKNKVCVGPETPDASRPKLGRPPNTPLYNSASDDVLTRPVVVNSEEPPEAEPVEILAPNLNYTINNVLLL